MTKEEKRAYDKARYQDPERRAAILARRKAYYHAHKPEAVAYSNRWNESKMAKMRAIYNAAKDGPCVDCGVQYPPFVMDLDHLPDFYKHQNVSQMVNNYRSNPEMLLAEIAKCELVCANCHRVRTHDRKEATREPYRKKQERGSEVGTPTYE